MDDDLDYRSIYESCIERARMDCRKPGFRKEIELWMRPSNYQSNFAAMCTVLGFGDLEQVRRYIREGSRPLATNQAKPTDGSLAAHRERIDEPGNPGPEWLLQLAGNLDRTEASWQEFVALPNELDQEAPGRGRNGLAGGNGLERLDSGMEPVNPSVFPTAQDSVFQPRVAGFLFYAPVAVEPNIDLSLFGYARVTP